MDKLEALSHLYSYNRYALALGVFTYFIFGSFIERFFSLNKVIKIEKLGLYLICFFFLFGDGINYMTLKTLESGSVPVYAIVSGTHTFPTRKGTRTGPIFTITEKNHAMQMKYTRAIFKTYELNEKVELLYYIPDPMRSIPNDWDGKYSRFMLLPLPLMGLLILFFKPHKTLFPKLWAYFDRKKKEQKNNL